MARNPNKLVPLGVQLLGRDIYISIPADLLGLDECCERDRVRVAWRALMEMAKDPPQKAKAARGEP